MLYTSNLGHFGRGGFHVDGIGTVYRANRGVRGFGQFQDQHGGGFGSFIASLVKKAVPFFKNTVLPAVAPALSEVKSSLQNAATNVLEDVVQGENVADALKKNLSSEGQKLLAKVPRAFSGLMTRSPDLEAASHSTHVKPSTSNNKRKSQSSKKSSTKKIRVSKARFPGLARI